MTDTHKWCGNPHIHDPHDCTGVTDSELPDQPAGVFTVNGRRYRLNLNPYGERDGHLHDAHGDGPSDLCPACTRDHEFTVRRDGAKPWRVSCSCGRFSMYAYDNEVTMLMTIHLQVELGIEDDR